MFGTQCQVASVASLKPSGRTVTLVRPETRNYGGTNIRIKILQVPWYVSAVSVRCLSSVPFWFHSRFYFQKKVVHSTVNRSAKTMVQERRGTKQSLTSKTEERLSSSSPGSSDQIVTGDERFEDLLSMKLSRAIVQQAMQKDEDLTEAARNNCQSYIDRIQANMALMAHCDRMHAEACAKLCDSHFLNKNKSKSGRQQGASFIRKSAKGK